MIVNDSYGNEILRMVKGDLNEKIPLKVKRVRSTECQDMEYE